MSLIYYHCLFLFFIFHFIIATGKILPAYIPTEIILLNCGTINSSTSLDGRNWVTDAQTKFGISNFQNSSSAYTASEQNPSVEIVPYMTARIFHSPFTYTFALSTGPKFIRLYFNPSANYSNFDISKSFFSLKADKFILLSNFSAFLTVSSIYPTVASIIKEFIIPVSETQVLNITFLPSPKSFAFINGIEIISMPHGLYARGFDTPLTYVGMDHPFYLDNTIALETFYRLNVGGADIDSSGDTGMYRKWAQDSDYIFGAAFGVTVISDVKINYTTSTPAFVAPMLVYSTVRSMGTNPEVNKNYNLTWIFPVDTGFHYLVRLHFCETAPDIFRMSQEVFSIFINNQTADDQADVIFWSGGNGVPVYEDYIAWFPAVASPSKQDLWLALHPNQDPEYTDAILNGLEVFKLSNSEGSLAGPNPEAILVNTPPQQHPELQETTQSKDVHKVVIITGSILAGFLFLATVISCLVFLQKRSRTRKEDPKSFRVPFPHTSTSIASHLPTERCHRFTIIEMKEATRNFVDQNLIGSGGFGKVYKGYIEKETTTVAIKRLDSLSKQGSREFSMEIEMLSQLRHVNLVSLIGYCIDEGEMILVYDYMINGTLREHLYESSSARLPWKERLRICIGAARGLYYLHSEFTHTVIHRDVKTSNILLDQRWIAKVSDFGLSRVALKLEVSTVVKGTWGYLDPEYASYQQLTDKSDVYSFGVVLVEVLCAKKPLDPKLVEDQMNLVIWAKKCIRIGNLYQIIDPHLMGKIAPECLKKFVEIAMSCVRDKGIERPSMRDVMQELEFAMELQEAAEAENKGINFDGEIVYPDVCRGVDSGEVAQVELCSTWSTTCEGSIGAMGQFAMENTSVNSHGEK